MGDKLQTVYLDAAFAVRVARSGAAPQAVAAKNEWPPSKRNAKHAVALNACKAALAGEIDVETARATFVAFAQRANLLAPDAEAIVAGSEVGARAQTGNSKTM